MKVLWISHFMLHPETGFGALQRSRNLLRYVAEQTPVHLVSLIDAKVFANRQKIQEAQASLSGFCASVRFLARDIGAAGALGRSLLGHSPYSVCLYRSERLAVEVERLLRQNPCDVVHADTLGVLEPDQTRAPIAVLNHHNIESAMMLRRAERERRPLPRRFLRREAGLLAAYERRWCSAFARHLCVSPEDADELARSAGVPRERIAVIENPVDVHYFAPPESGPARSPELLFMGGMDWYPNRDAMTSFLHEIWPGLSRAVPTLRVTVVGRSEGMEAYADERVEFPGFVPDVRPYVHRALAFICPMKDGGGTRLKIVDALASGLPVISTRLGCEGLAVRDREEVLFAERPDEWIAAVKFLLADDAAWRRLSRQGRELIDCRYSVPKVGARLLDVYRSVAARNS